MAIYRIAIVTFYYPNHSFKSRLKFDTRKLDNIGFTKESLLDYIKLISKDSFSVDKDTFYSCTTNRKISITL